MEKFSPGSYIDALQLRLCFPHPIHGPVTFGSGHGRYAFFLQDGYFPHKAPARLRRSYWRLKRLQRGGYSTFKIHMFKHEI